MTDGDNPDSEVLRGRDIRPNTEAHTDDNRNRDLPTVDGSLAGPLPLRILGGASGGSGNGISNFLGLLCCPRRQTNSRGVDGGDGSDDADVGTYFHALAEAYYLDSFSKLAVEFESYANNPAAVEAMRLFAHYRKRFPRTEFGEVIGAEIPLKTDVGEVKDVTGKLDLVVRIDEDSADYVAELRKIDVEPGIYIIDHKTKKQKSSILTWEMQLRPQFAWYCMLWDMTHEEKCKGTIANIIFRYKDPDKNYPYLSMFVPPPNEQEQEMVRGIFRDGDEVLRTKGPQWANPVHCFDFHRVCPFLLDGSCDRKNS